MHNKNPTSKKLSRILSKNKQEIIDFAVDQWDEYSTEWLAKQIMEIWWEDLPETASIEEIEAIVKDWEVEITDLINESLESDEIEESKMSLVLGKE